MTHDHKDFSHCTIEYREEPVDLPIEKAHLVTDNYGATLIAEADFCGGFNIGFGFDAERSTQIVNVSDLREIARFCEMLADNLEEHDGEAL